MPKFSLKNFRSSLSKEKRQIKQEERLTKQLNKEKSKYERYASVSAQDERIKKLKDEIKSYRQIRRKSKLRKVKIGGHTFKI